MTTHVFILLGGVTGYDGQITSRGMLNLGYKLAALPDTNVVTHEWSQAQAVVDAIKKLHASDDKLVLIGYSGGGPAAIVVANAIAPRPVHLMVLFDPSPASQMVIHRTGSNVERAECYYDTSLWLIALSLGLGGGYIRGKAKSIENLRYNELHLDIQNDPNLHARVINIVRDLA